MDRDELDMMDLADAAQPWAPLMYKIDQPSVLFPLEQKKIRSGSERLFSRDFSSAYALAE